MDPELHDHPTIGARAGCAACALTLADLAAGRRELALQPA